MTDRSVRVRLSLSHSDFSRGLATVTGETSAFVRTLDTSNNRMSTLVQTGIALGPALVPVMGAVTAGGIGMAEALGATAVGAGVAVLAFHGVGDALKALNTFALDPTAAHLQTLHEKMAALGPDGQRFVFMLQDLRPELEKLQATAAHGLLPGVTEGLDHLLSVQPQIESLVANIADALGHVASEGGRALASPFWTDFLDFLATDGRDSMVTMLNIIGQLMKATASLIMAFDPLSQDIGGALLEKTQELAKWADQLDQSQGFADFTDWMERVGPKVWDTLGAIGEALVEIVKAAAPVGEITLPILTALAEAISAIAASPAGPILIGIAAGINAVSRALALSRAVGGSAVGGFLFGPAPKATAGLSPRQLQIEAATAATARYSSMLRIAAASAAVFALAQTNVDESLGLSNTASFAAIGSVGGPYGALLGTLIGLSKDMISVNDDVTASIERVRRAIDDPGNIRGMQQAIHALRREAEDTGSPSFVQSMFTGGIVPSWLRSKAEDQGNTAADQAAIALTDYKDALSALINVAHGKPADFADWTGNTRALTQAAADARPVLDRMGIGLKDLAGIHNVGMAAPWVWRDFVRAFHAAAASMDSQPARTGRVVAAFAELNNEVVDTTTSAQDLSAALDELLNPQMDLEASTDAYTTALRHWRGELSKASKTLEGNTDAAIKNRTSLRSRVGLLKDQLNAEAQAGWGSDRLTNSMQRERKALIDAAVAAGLNRKEVKDLIATYGLTPHLIKTLIEANTDSAKAKIRELHRMLNSLHDRNITVGVTFDRGIGPGQNVGPTGGNAYGGQVFGPGGPREDKVPRMLSNREWVQPVSSVDYYGEGFMRAVQNRTLPRMAGGGPVAWFEDGTSRGSRISMGYGARTSVAGDARSGSVKISGRLTLGADGTAYIRGIVRDEMSGDSEFVASAARQRGS